MQDTARRPRLVGLLDLALVLTLFVVVSLISAVYQQRISLRGGQGWDGVQYHRMAREMAEGHRPKAEAPFVYRIGTPLLASLVAPHHIIDGFRDVNVVANLLAAALLVLWLRRYIQNWKLRVLLSALYLTLWLGPTRFTFFMPVYVDPWPMVFILAGLLMMDRITDRGDGWLAMSLISFVGVIFREDTLLLPVALLAGWYLTQWQVVETPARRRLLIRMPPLPYLAPLIAGLLGLVATHAMAIPTNAFAYPSAAAGWALNKPLLSYLLAWFLTFGPILTLALFDWRHSAGFLRERPHLLAYLVGVALIAWIGGLTTERYLLWAAPIVFVVVGKAIERNASLLRSSALLVAALAVAQFLAQRLLWTVPDYPGGHASALPLFTVFSSHGQYYDLQSWFSATRIRAVFFVEYAVFTAIVIGWLQYRLKRLRHSAEVAPAVRMT